ncbi:ATP-binding protein [Salmonella enterica subsp. salamae]|uniref:AAA family ATPase n=2 Tax=Salmonella enterica TaxID=28901 RepID=A0A603KRY2_SALER|nr:AAA family ATPase [Citrobacter freundii]EAA6245594.1 ATP-binding protein [Salmonella enterica subsp. salamae]EAM3921228.1 AAA family ATPase [Salmonella enterica]EBP3807306.1 AAA family ATPase [Salmonella enterica subsp. enterica]EDX4957700.1 ATP-binding protein [Salmonella enterica subsp. salamae serovar 58:l,z13,z28:z6]SUG26002.1 ATPase AAA [Salmonella enterica subsp. arizonae]HDX8776046.1 ATP-binding protein [Klebsiella oxytoca]
MENFNTILSICRVAMENPNPTLTGHIKRLVAKLRSKGDERNALSLEKLLDSQEEDTTLVPSRITLTKPSISWGEKLTKAVKPPVDKETGNILAEIIFPENEKSKPIFDHAFETALDSMLYEWKHADLLRQNGIITPLSCLLYGAPGTGKTKTAFYISDKLSLPIVIARLDGLISSFLGTTARNIATLFDFANRYKCVLLLDEFDAIAKIRDDPHELGEIKRVVNTLLQCIDNRISNGFTIAITNHEKLLDTAVWRRFDTKIHIPKPNSEVRKKLIASFSHELNDTEISLLAWITIGFSGADVETLCNFIKRKNILSKEKICLIENLRSYVYLNDGVLIPEMKEILASDNESMAYAILHSSNGLFTQEKIAMLFSKDKSTISRWLNKNKEKSHE